MVKLGMALSGPFVFLSHMWCLLFCLYEARFTGGGLLSGYVPTSIRSFMTSHINAKPLLPEGSNSPQGSAGRHWLSVHSWPHGFWSTWWLALCACICLFDSLRVEYVSLSSSFSPFPLFWGFQRKCREIIPSGEASVSSHHGCMDAEEFCL